MAHGYKILIALLASTHLAAAEKPHLKVEPFTHKGGYACEYGERRSPVKRDHVDYWVRCSNRNNSETCLESFFAKTPERKGVRGVHVSQRYDKIGKIFSLKTENAVATEMREMLKQRIISCIEKFGQGKAQPFDRGVSSVGSPRRKK